MGKITSEELHICASVLLDAQWRGAGGRWEGGEKALLNGAHFLSEIASNHADTVTVPRELLRQVIEDSETNAICVKASGQFDQDFSAEYARIAELRRAAGMEEEQ